MAPTMPPMGLAKGPTKGSTGGVKANPALAPNKAAGVAAADSAAERAKVPPAVVGIFFSATKSLKDELLTRSSDGLVTTSSSAPQEDLATGGAAEGLETTSSSCPKSAMINPSYVLQHHLVRNNYRVEACRTLLY